MGYLAALFGAAFVAATLLPAQSELVLAAGVAREAAPVAVLLAVATLGNVLGSLVNWGLGRWCAERSWFPLKGRARERALLWYGRYGLWTLLGSWLPVIGDPLTLVAGVMRAPLWSFLALVTLAKGARYAIVAAAVMM